MVASSHIRSLSKYSIGGSQGFFVLFSRSMRKWSHQIICGEKKERYDLEKKPQTEVQGVRAS